MYSRFSKKEIVALGMTSATTLAMASVLFFASADTNTPSAEDFMADLEQTFQAPPTTPKPATTNGSSSNSNTSTNSNSTSNAGSSNTNGNGVAIVNSPTTSVIGGNSTATTGNTVVTSNPPATSQPTQVVIPAAGVSFGTSSSTVTSSGNPTTAGATSTLPPLNSAKQCNLPTIDILQTEELDTKTVVRWRHVPNAAGYDVMKRSKSGEFVLIERVIEPIYTAHLARGSVKYEDFKVAAVCGDTKSASINTSQVTSVKTGPVHVAILMISLLMSAAIVLRKRFAKI